MERIRRKGLWLRVPHVQRIAILLSLALQHPANASVVLDTFPTTVDVMSAQPIHTALAEEWPQRVPFISIPLLAQSPSPNADALSTPSSRRPVVYATMATAARPTLQPP